MPIAPTFTTNWSGDLIYPQNFNILTKFKNFVGTFYDTTMWLDAIDGIDPGSIRLSNTQISANFIGGGSMVISGSGFYSGVPTITSMVITTADGWRMTALGTVYGIDMPSGIITTYQLESPDGRFIYIAGSIDPNTGEGTLTQIMYHSAQGDVVLKGNFTYNQTSNAIDGTLTFFKVSDAYGHWQKVSGVSLPATGLDAIPSIDTLIQTMMQGPDVSTGDANANVLKGFAGNDTLSGLGGNDALVGGDGNDTLDGGTGADTLNGGAGGDSMNGGAGSDVYWVDSLDDVITDDSGADTVKSSVDGYSLSPYASIENLILTGTDAIGGSGNIMANTLTGNTAANTLSGDVGNDTLYGGDGNDILNGDADNDTLKGQAGNDALDGGAGNDSLMGGGGDDVLYGGTGADVMYGGAGNDTYKVDNAGDKAYDSTDATGAVDATGTDLVESSVSFTLSAFIENLTLTDVGGVIDGTGNALKNTINGNDSANTLNGCGGGDTLFGDGGDDILKGGGGNDMLNGGVGNDVLYGGPGNDTLAGGAGDDIFVFNAALNTGVAPNVDTIADFKANADADKIHLDNAIFTKLKTEGALSAENFREGTAAAGSKEYIIYDSLTGNLWYDADGNGAGAKVKIAVLTDHPTLTASDIVVI